MEYKPTVNDKKNKRIHDYPYLDTVIYDDFRAMLKDRSVKNADMPAVEYMQHGERISITYRQYTDDVARMYVYLKKQQMCGIHIGIFFENRYEYLVLYLAAMFGNVAAPLDRELDPDTLRQCIEKFDIAVIFCTNKTKETVLRAAENAELPLRNMDEIFEREVKKIDADRAREQFFRETKDVDKDAFAVLAATSGTDGAMKGVMLSQYNIIVNVRDTLENTILNNPTYAFLPMNHTYGMHPGILATLYNGTTVCLCIEMKYFLRDLKTFDPDFFCAVPMVIEGIYENIRKEARRQNKEKKLDRAIKISNFLRKFHIDIRHKLFGDLLCGRLTKVVSGGAPLPSYYVERFDELGIKLLNGYGMTECAPTVAVCREFNNVAGSAGIIMKHIDVKIAQDGEILVKGPNVMLGYYNDEAATASCISDGYFHTGDLGYTNEKVLFVTGRKKNLIVLQNGKNVSPEYLEEKLCALGAVQDALVVLRKSRSQRDILTAMIRLNESARQIKDIRSQLMQNIEAVNRTIPAYMRIDDVQLMEQDFEKTSSKKIKRNLYV